MNIAFVAQPFDAMYPLAARTGSLALWIYYMAKACAKRGHRVIVFANHGGGRVSAKSVNSENVKYIFTPTGLDRVLDRTSNAGSKLVRSAGRANPLRPLFASTWHHLGYAAEVAHRAGQLGCDVVHVTNYSQFVPVIRKLHPRCRIVLHMHCEWLNQLDANLVEKRLKQTDLVMGASEYITRKTAGKFPQYANSCVTVPAGGELPSNGRSHPDSRAVLCVNRLSPEKGIHILIRAFHQVLKQFPDATLHLVGGAWAVPLELLVELSDEPQVKALGKFYQKRGNGTKDPYVEVLEKEAGQELGKRIIFEGHVVHDQIGQYYERAAVLVSASIWNEPYGTSSVEAMMHGVPVVATRVGGMAYNVDHGRTGFVVDPEDPTALAKAICEVLGDRKRARQMGEAGRKRALEKFSWEKSADLLLEHFKALLSR
jgi:glycosyltransferase involved in cell wall biosynthesis